MSTYKRPVPWDTGSANRLLLLPAPGPCAAGHDVRSLYVETFWLPVIGPSATCLARAVARILDVAPQGVTVCMDDLAASIGLAAGAGRHSVFRRTLRRCIAFGIAQPASFDSAASAGVDDLADLADLAGTNASDREPRGTLLMVYFARCLPPIGPRMLAAFPQRLRSLHETLEPLSEEERQGGDNGA